jgi:hypothetical protein
VNPQARLGGQGSVGRAALTSPAPPIPRATQRKTCRIVPVRALLRVHLHAGRPTLNAITTIETDDDAVTELTDLKRTLALIMDMIEDAAARALGRKPEPEGTPEERKKRPDPGVQFIRLTAAQRQTMAAKDRLVTKMKAEAQAQPTVTPAQATPQTPPETTPDTPDAPAEKVYSGNQQEYMNSTSLSERLSPYAHKFANRSFPAVTNPK